MVGFTENDTLERTQLFRGWYLKIASAGILHIPQYKTFHYTIHSNQFQYSVWFYAKKTKFPLSKSVNLIYGQKIISLQNHYHLLNAIAERSQKIIHNHTLVASSFADSLFYFVAFSFFYLLSVLLFWQSHRNMLSHLLNSFFLAGIPVDSFLCNWLHNNMFKKCIFVHIKTTFLWLLLLNMTFLPRKMMHLINFGVFGNIFLLLKF